VIKQGSGTFSCIRFENIKPSPWQVKFFAHSISPSTGLPFENMRVSERAVREAIYKELFLDRSATFLSWCTR
jgi:hypothetical protein